MSNNDDDWETSGDIPNPISEKQQRWGAATLPQNSTTPTNLTEFREKIINQDDEKRQQEYIDKSRRDNIG